MEFQLKSNLMRKLAAKLIKRLIFSKTATDVNLTIDKLKIERVNERLRLHLMIQADMNEKDILKLVKLTEDDLT